MISIFWSVHHTCICNQVLLIGLLLLLHLFFIHFLVSLNTYLHTLPKNNVSWYAAYYLIYNEYSMYWRFLDGLTEQKRVLMKTDLGNKLLGFGIDFFLPFKRFKLLHLFFHLKTCHRIYDVQSTYSILCFQSQNLAFWWLWVQKLYENISTGRQIMWWTC